MTAGLGETPPDPSPTFVDADEGAPPTAPKRRVGGRPRGRHALTSASGSGTVTEGDEGALIAAVGRIENLLMILVRRAVQPVLEEELKDSTARAIYEATGEKTAREIAQATGVGVATVSRTWARWESLGLVVKEGSRYRRPF